MDAFAARSMLARSSPGIPASTLQPHLAAAPPGREAAILAPGRNCWRIAQADEATVLIDAATYFDRLERALRTAEHSIDIVGWDFDHRICLQPGADRPPLGRLLRALVEARPALRVRVLVWSLAPFHGPGSAMALLFGARWHKHPRIEVRLDRKHPIYASHHQKIVCIDDAIAFSGGMDLTLYRWDTTRHSFASTRRTGPEGKHYPPVHDVQMLLTGEAARSIAALTRERWRRATGEEIPPGPATRRACPQPDAASRQFTAVNVAIARTHPAQGGEAAVREVAALTVDAIAAARRWIYIETQYLTSRLVGEALMQSLGHPEGPEILIVTTHRSPGVMEHLVMGRNRDRLYRLLRQRDPGNRLRLYYPVVPGPKRPRGIKVHSKVMIVDDRLLRIGSANLNNRSMGLDTECDIAIESGSPEAQRQIAGIRSRLMGEHLSAAPEAVAATLAETGSLFAVVDRLNQGPRGLRPFTDRYPNGPTRPIPLTWLLDPPGAIGH